MEMRLEKLLEHRRRDAAAPAARQRRENHRHVHVALVIRREHHRPVERRADSTAPRRARARTARVSGTIQVACDSRRISRTGPAAVPRREVDRLLDGFGGRRRFDELLEIGDAGGLGEPRLVDPRLEPVFERDHQLDPFERRQAELLERGRAADVTAARVPADQRLERIALRHGQRLAAGLHPVANGRAVSACACLRCAAARVPGQTEIVRMRWWSCRRALASRTTRSGSTPASSDDHRVHAFLRALRHADDR